jgi:N utilization substance protein B
MSEEQVKLTNGARRLTRLASVQALYQLALTQEDPEAVIRRFKQDPTVFLQEDEAIIDLDKGMFAAIVDGVFNNQTDIDAMIGGAVDARLSAERMEPLLKAILRAGTYELLHTGAPTGVIVNDYIDVAHGFFDAKEPGLVNAVLDRLAKKLRS